LLARRPFLRRLIPIAAAALLTAGIVVGILPDGMGGAEPAAAAVLNRAGAGAAAAPVPRTADGTIWYTDTRHETVSLDRPNRPVTGNEAKRAFLAQRRYSSRVWLALPDRQRYDQDSAETVVAPSDRAAWIAAGSPDFYKLPSLTDDPGTLDTWQLLLDEDLVRTGDVPARGAPLRRELDLLHRLPTDPGSLRSWLELQVSDNHLGAVGWCPVDAGSCSTEAKVFQATAALLASPIAPPALRSALFRVLAGVRGVHLDGEVTDNAGRPATKISIVTGHLRYELLLDPDTATLLGTAQVLMTTDAADADPQWTGAAPGTVVRSDLYVKSQVVTTIGATT
jgi:hypothetical protein